MTRSQMIKKLDGITRKKYLKQRCEICRQTHGLSRHHFIHRYILAVRWTEQNLVTVCIDCHNMIHTQTGGSKYIDDYMKTSRPEDYSYLRAVKLDQMKTFEIEQKLKEANAL